MLEKLKFLVPLSIYAARPDIIHIAPLDTYTCMINDCFNAYLIRIISDKKAHDMLVLIA